MSMQDLVPDELLNPAATRGHNEAPPFAQVVTERMAREYAELQSTVAELGAEAETMPASITTDEEAAPISALVVKLRDVHGRAKAFHKKEKEPYLRGGEAVDAFFFTLMETVQTTGKNLTGIVNDLKQRQLAEERRRREEAAAEARRIEAEARAKLAEEQRLRDEAAAAAARARKPETIETHQEKAAEHADAAEVARVDTMMARDKAEVATHATLAKPSAMVGKRFEAAGIGGKVTMRQVPKVAIIDASKLDLEKLRPFIAEAALLSALKAWAKVTGHKTMMEGASILMVDDTVIR